MIKYELEEYVCELDLEEDFKKLYSRNLPKIKFSGDQSLKHKKILEKAKSAFNKGIVLTYNYEIEDLQG